MGNRLVDYGQWTIFSWIMDYRYWFRSSRWAIDHCFVGIRLLFLDEPRYDAAV